jgi:hypothetical protein
VVVGHSTMANDTGFFFATGGSKISLQFIKFQEQREFALEVKTLELSKKGQTIDNAIPFMLLISAFDEFTQLLSHASIKFHTNSKLMNKKHKLQKGEEGYTNQVSAYYYQIFLAVMLIHLLVLIKLLRTWLVQFWNY